MSLMKQFARNKRSKGNTIVVTARLPESLYDKFQMYCEEYGFSLSECINLLIANEIESIETEDKNDVETIDDERKVNTDEYKVNTSSDEMKKNEVRTKQKDSRTNRSSGETNTAESKRFKYEPFLVDGKVPCPLCGIWETPTNYSRHAKKHGGKSAKEILTENPDKVQAMIESRKAELEAKEEVNND